MRIGLDPRRDFSGTKLVKVRDILPQHGLEISFPNPLCIDFSRPLPDEHVGVRADEHADTDVDEVRSVVARGMLQVLTSGVECCKDSRIRVVALGGENTLIGGELGERGGEFTKDETGEVMSARSFFEVELRTSLMAELHQRPQPKQVPIR